MKTKKEFIKFLKGHKLYDQTHSYILDWRWGISIALFGTLAALLLILGEGPLKRWLFLVIIFALSTIIPFFEFIHDSEIWKDKEKTIDKICNDLGKKIIKLSGDKSMLHYHISYFEDLKDDDESINQKKIFLHNAGFENTDFSDKQINIQFQQFVAIKQKEEKDLGKQIEDLANLKLELLSFSTYNQKVSVA